MLVPQGVRAAELLILTQEAGAEVFREWDSPEEIALDHHLTAAAVAVAQAQQVAQVVGILQVQEVLALLMISPECRFSEQAAEAVADTGHNLQVVPAVKVAVVVVVATTIQFMVLCTVCIKNQQAIMRARVQTTQAVVVVHQDTTAVTHTDPVAEAAQVW
jgi:hypothetical protein